MSPVRIHLAVRRRGPRRAARDRLRCGDRPSETASTGSAATSHPGLGGRRHRPAGPAIVTEETTGDRPGQCLLRRRRDRLPARPVRRGRRPVRRLRRAATPRTPGATTCTASRPGSRASTSARSRASTRRSGSTPSTGRACSTPRGCCWRPAVRARRWSASSRRWPSSRFGRRSPPARPRPLRAGRGPEAIDAYQRALALDDRDVWAMNNLGLLYIQQGRFEEALPPLARAVELRANVAGVPEQPGHGAGALGPLRARRGRPTRPRSRPTAPTPRRRPAWRGSAAPIDERTRRPRWTWPRWRVSSRRKCSVEA